MARRRTLRNGFIAGLGLVATACAGGDGATSTDASSPLSADSASPSPDAARAAADASNTPDASTNVGSDASSEADAQANMTADATKNDAAPIVIPCSGLSASVGKWENISPPAFTNPPNMEALAVVVDPTDGTVFAAAGNVTNGGACPSGRTCPSGATGIQRSTDCGATWSRVNDDTQGTDSARLLTGDPWAMLIDPVTPSTMYINNGYGDEPTIYKSINGGVDWKALNPDPTHAVGSPYPFVQAIAIDPFDRAHLAVTFHANCAAPYNPWCFSESSDGGDTWKLFNGPTSVPGFMVGGWAEASSISILGATSYIVLSPQGGYFTADGGATWTLVLAFIDYTSYAGSTYIAPDGTLFLGCHPPYYSPPAPGQSPPFALYQAPTLPVPSPRLPYQTGLAPAVMPVPNGPAVTQIISDGVSLFGSDNLGQPPFWTAPLSDPTSWTQMPDSICANGICRGSNELAYDPVNHIVYSANWGAGLWRLKTR
jgi:hypothetical protein